MLNYPDIDPVALDFGRFQVHWYGILFLVAFASAWWLGKIRAQQPDALVKPDQIEDLVFYGALGAVLGGRLGSVFFYNFDNFLQDPHYLYQIWKGGMSFHGGFLGVLLAMEWYRRKIGCRFWELTDFIAPLIPLGLAAGRLGNFINAELWGAPGNVPWAFKLSCERFKPEQYIDYAGPLCYSPRHPTQLYELMLEGILLFVILWLISRRQRPVMLVSACFLLFYGLARCAVEFIRLPDAHIGYLLGTDWLTRGIVLSLPMIIVGVVLLMLVKRGQTRAAIP